jgi:hypothetical protein
MSLVHAFVSPCPNHRTIVIVIRLGSSTGGIVLSRSLGEQFTSDFLGDLAGNSFCAYTVLAIWLSWLLVLAKHEQPRAIALAPIVESDTQVVAELLDQVDSDVELLNMLDEL